MTTPNTKAYDALAALRVGSSFEDACGISGLGLSEVMEIWKKSQRPEMSCLSLEKATKAVISELQRLAYETGDWCSQGHGGTVKYDGDIDPKRIAAAVIRALSSI